MGTECKTTVFDFQAVGNRQVVGAFDGGYLSSDGGLILLRELEERTGIVKRFSKCFWDMRNQEWVEHPLEDLLKQRVFGLIAGYEDINDHDSLREDVLFAVACGKSDPTGQHRIREEDRGKALAGKSTLNRMELGSNIEAPWDKYKKISLRSQDVDDLFIDIFAESQSPNPDVLIVDLDATNDPLHGQQEGTFFNGYYDQYCYLPLYIFCGDHLLLARLQTSDVDPANAGMIDIRGVVRKLRRKFPKTRLIVRGDSGFCRDELMYFCERMPRVDYVLGLAKNPRLLKANHALMEQAKEQFDEQKEGVKLYQEFRYRTLDSWSKERRVHRQSGTQ